MNPNDQAPLLASKAKPPRLSKGLVPRHRLESYVDELEEYLLIVVNAPSGFGKSTLGATWARELSKRSTYVSWLTLDQEDNDSSQFLRYLGYSITSVEHGKLGDQSVDRTLPHSPLRGREYTTQLINYIAEVGDEFYIFLDDFQVITDAGIHSHIVFLLQNAPSNFHLVLLSRAERTNIATQKTLIPLEITAADLCFTLEETATLFAGGAQRTQQAARAHTATGGWPAALHILASANTDILDSVQTTKGQLRSQQSFARLLDTVLLNLTPEEVRLIELTSVVVRMCVPLLNELTGATDGLQLIVRTEIATALISRTTDDGYWIGCHDLVRQATLDRLSQTDPAFINDIADRASQWYAQQGYWIEAVTQALAIGNHGLALKWISTCGTKLVQTGDVLVLLNWDRILKLSSNKDTPDDILLSLAFAQVLGSDGKEKAGLATLINAKTGSGKSLYSRSPPWRWLSLHAVYACCNDDLEIAREIAEQGLKFAPLHLHEVSETYKNVAGYCYLHARDWENFYALPQVRRTGVTTDSLLIATYRFLLFSIAEITQANFSRAQRYLDNTYRESSTGLGTSSLPSSLPGALLAFLHFEKLELSKAEYLLSEHLDVCAASGYFDIISRAFVAASRIAQLRKHPENALKLLEQFEKLALESNQVRAQIICSYEKMQFFIAEKRLGLASVCLSNIVHLYQTAIESKGLVRPESKNYAGLAQGQYAMFQGRFKEAESVLQKVYFDASDTGDMYMLIVSGTALAIAQHQNGKTQESLVTFESILAPAQAAEMRASLLYQATSIDPLLLFYRKNALRDSAAWRHINFVESLIGKRNAGKETVLVKLTPREKDILELIARGMSNKEISNVLNIAPETVKGYLKGILIKFDVNKRATAVSRASSMGLLQNVL